ncbi:hypothetical protein [Streptomyces sp. NPDC088775]|uniref:hypothetical protein n=1 Tax=Streptomyces sp. NPDC088775 TaxID=3365896 RepID=UPI0037F13C9B
MVEQQQYTAGYAGAVFEDGVAEEKALLTAGNGGAEPARWFVDTEEERPALEELIEDLRAGKVGRVVIHNKGSLPNDPCLIGDFYDAVLGADAELIEAAPRTTPSEKSAAQLLPLLHEWSRTEADFLAARGHHTIYAGDADVRWLRDFLGQSDAPQAKRWLERLLPDISECPEGAAGG